MTLEELRDNIDRIDREMADLFSERMKISKQIAEIKYNTASPVFNPEREKALIEKNTEYLSDKSDAPYYRDFEKNVMRVSKLCQKNVIASLSAPGTIAVNIGDGYYIHTGRRSIDKIADYGKYNKTLLVFDFNIDDRFIDEVYDAVSSCGKTIKYVLQNGERYKSFEQLESILLSLTENSFTRYDRIISFGGGVCGDICGLAASLYMRGIDFYNIPSTVLSQCDASVGGKTAINLYKSRYKNLVGTFYQPKAVFIDTEYLSSLDKRQISNGVAEIIKISATLSEDLFDKIGKTDIEEIIYKSVILKKKIVEEDTYEEGLRRVLNFGHTVGHAIEELGLGYLHGECVGLGMLVMSDGKANYEIYSKLKEMGLPIYISSIKPGIVDKIIDGIKHDKKSYGDGINCILCDEIGHYTEKKLTFDEIKERIIKSRII